MVGGLDEEFKVAYNDVDFCLKVRASGFKNIYTPFSELIHHESKTRGEDVTEDKLQRLRKEQDLLFKKWGDSILNDPYYNQNLTKSAEDFSISI